MESPLEKLLISAHKPVIMQFLDKHPESFKEAMQLALSDKHPYSWRAAWMMWGYIKKKRFTHQALPPENYCST